MKAKYPVKYSLREELQTLLGAVRVGLSVLVAGLLIFHLLHTPRPGDVAYGNWVCKTFFGKAFTEIVTQTDRNPGMSVSQVLSTFHMRGHTHEQFPRIAEKLADMNFGILGKFRRITLLLGALALIQVVGKRHRYVFIVSGVCLVLIGLAIAPWLLTHPSMIPDISSEYRFFDNVKISSRDPQLLGICRKSHGAWFRVVLYSDGHTSSMKEEEVKKRGLDLTEQKQETKLERNPP